MKIWVLAKSVDGDIEPFVFDEKEFQPRLGRVIPKKFGFDAKWKVVKIYSGSVNKTLNTIYDLWIGVKGNADDVLDTLSVLIKDAIKKSQIGKISNINPKKGIVFHMVFRDTSPTITEKKSKFERIKKTKN